MPSALIILGQVILGLGFIFVCHHSETNAFSIGRSRIRTNPGGATAAATTAAFDPPKQIPFQRPFTTDSRVVLKGFLDGIFGGGDDNGEEGNDAILGSYNVRTFDYTDDESITVGFDSLSDYITVKWMDLFESKSISLTTPVKVFKRSDTNDETSDSETDIETIVESAKCRLVFQKVDTGYKDDDDDDDDNNDNKEKPKEEVRQGGVEILVQKVLSTGDTDKISLRVIARRCEVDDDTMIKEMSEEIIVKELQTAIAVWKKEATV